MFCVCSGLIIFIFYHSFSVFFAFERLVSPLFHLISSCDFHISANGRFYEFVDSFSHFSCFIGIIWIVFFVFVFYSLRIYRCMFFELQSRFTAYAADPSSLPVIVTNEANHKMWIIIAMRSECNRVQLNSFTESSYLCPYL